VSCAKEAVPDSQLFEPPLATCRTSPPPSP
jgi:hypothetical protein